MPSKPPTSRSGPLFLADLREVVGQEDIRRLGDLVEQLLPLGGRQIDADAALAAIGMLEQRVTQRIERHATHVEEAALRIAAHRVLDLDDIRAPVGEDRPCGGHEGELGHLQHAHALHDLGHGFPISQRRETSAPINLQP